MRVFNIKSPTSVIVPAKGGKTKRFYINKNAMLRANFWVISKAKHNYKELVKEQIMALPELGRVKVLFTIHRGTKARSDRCNVCSEVDKWFMDSLVHFGKLEDDDDFFYEYNVYKSGEICKGDPHVMITIAELVTKVELDKITENRPPKKDKK